MSRNSTTIAMLIALIAATAVPHAIIMGQTTVLREGAEQLLRAVAKYFGKKTIREGAEELAEYGGEALARRLAGKIVREGGEESLERVAELTARYGPDVLRAVEHAPSSRVLLRVLDDLPADELAPALRRLSAGPAGRKLASLAEHYGAAAIRAELRHPGVGMRLVEHLGDDGIRLAEKLTPDQALTLARHAPDIARLPEPQRESLLRLIYKDAKKVIEFIGEFTKRNPGKTLFTVATTTVILANSERLFGGECEILYGPDGKPEVVKKRGLVGTVTQTIVDKTINPLLAVLPPIVAVGAVTWLAIRLWAAYRLQRIKIAAKEAVLSGGQQHARPADKPGEATGD